MLLDIDKAASGMRQFTKQSVRGLGAIRSEVKLLQADFNGLSAATKLFNVSGGFSAVRNTLKTNFSFERDILELKQNSGMLKEHADELRRLAISSADSALQTPQEILAGMKEFARSGEQFEGIKAKVVEAARAATVFRTSVEEIASMDFDLTDKLNIDPSRLNRAHNMLYYHSKGS